jgi:hypothetical protein
MTPTFHEPRVASPVSQAVTDACCRLGAWIRRQRRRVVLFPNFFMGQYFKAVNLDKREVVCPWCLGGGAKLWEWAANPHGALFTLLLRKSSATGGGDFYNPLPSRLRTIQLDSSSPQRAKESFAAGIAQAAAAEGQPVTESPDSVVGRWAGDRVVLVGDYDESEMWDELPTYRNVSKELAEAWNEFIGNSDMLLRFNPMCACQKEDAS